MRLICLTRRLAAACLLGIAAPRVGHAQAAQTPASLEAACTRNDGDACASLGVMLTDGDRVAVDVPRGASLFQKACAANDARGCMLWGYALQNGRGTTANVIEALAAYERSCTGKNALGCNNAGFMYQSGTGTARDEAIALTRYTTACDLRLGLGCRNLGVLHADAVTLRQDRVPAVAAFEKGCAFGDLDSCNKQAWHLEQGLGTARDVNKARVLYAKACDGGFALACANGRALAASSGAGAAVASDGFLVCSAYMSEGRKLFYTFPFAGLQRRTTELSLAYVAMLREKRYAAASMYAPAGSPPPQLTVDCRWHQTTAEATTFKDRLVAGATRERMTVVPTSFDPL